MNNIQQGARVRVCPYCGQKFLGKMAMRQHLQSVHKGGLTVPTVKPALIKPRKSKKKTSKNKQGGNNGSRTVSGTDIISVVTVQAPAAVGVRIAEIQVNPRYFLDTRARQESLLWARWRPLKLSVLIAPSAGNFVTGSYLAGWTPDPAENLPSTGDASVRRLSTFRVNMEKHVSVPITLSIPCDASRKWYSLETSDDHDKDHGVLMIILSAAIGNLQGSVSFSIHLNWTIQYDGPDMPVEAEVSGIYADSSYTPYFTDSSSDWLASKYLTLKHAEGGYVVPFPEAKTGVIYELDKSATLQYYDSDSKLQPIKFGVRPKDFTAYNILAVFQTQAKAKAYAETGSVDNLLVFKAAGPYVAPNNPRWQTSSTGTSLETLLSLRGPSISGPGPADQLLKVMSSRLASLESEIKMLKIEKENLSIASEADSFDDLLDQEPSGNAP